MKWILPLLVIAAFPVFAARELHSSAAGGERCRNADTACQQFIRGVGDTSPGVGRPPSAGFRVRFGR